MIIGMGVGFILTALVKRVERRFTLVIPYSIGSIALMLTGVFFIVLGLYMLGLVKISVDVARYIGGTLFLLLGLWLITLGLKFALKRE